MSLKGFINLKTKLFIFLRYERLLSGSLFRLLFSHKVDYFWRTFLGFLVSFLMIKLTSRPELGIFSTVLCVLNFQEFFLLYILAKFRFFIIIIKFLTPHPFFYLRSLMWKKSRLMPNKNVLFAKSLNVTVLFFKEFAKYCTCHAIVLLLNLPSSTRIWLLFSELHCWLIIYF